MDLLNWLYSDLLIILLAVVPNKLDFGYKLVQSPVATGFDPLFYCPQVHRDLYDHWVHGDIEFFVVYWSKKLLRLLVQLEQIDQLVRFAFLFFRPTV